MYEMYTLAQTQPCLSWPAHENNVMKYSSSAAVCLSVLTCHNLQVEQTGALANCIAGGTLVESCGAGADVSQCHSTLHLV